MGTALAFPQFGYDFSRVPLHPADVAFRTILEISQPGDGYEREAERAADRVMSMTEPPAQAGWVAPPQTGPVAGGEQEPAALPPVVREGLRSPGRPLDSATRAFMEPRFGHDFSSVLVHTSERAARSADAVDALAYTVGAHIVFGVGQHAPTSTRGRGLLAHELAHVVQQKGATPLHGDPSERLSFSRAPGRSLARKKPAPREAKKGDRDEAAKRDTLRRHVEQQRRVADILAKARMSPPTLKNGPLDPDNLFRNSVGMLDSGKVTLTILSPTHYSSAIHFDARVRYPTTGGDYPARPMVLDSGTVHDDTSAFGKIKPLPTTAPPQSGTMPPKEEPARGRVRPATGEVEPVPTSRDPAPSKNPALPPAPLPFTPRDIWLFTRGLDITEEGLKNTFVHEVQHVADLHSLQPTGNVARDKLEGYKTEFRAFWIQPPPKRHGAVGLESIDRLPAPTDKPDNSRKVQIPKPQDCTICPAPVGKGAYVKPEPGMKNARQQAIFEHIMARYPDQQYACCYVYNKEFHEGVDRFAYPESVNLINSDRLVSLNLELRNLTPTMSMSQVGHTKVVTLLTQLDPLDWMFLKERRLSQPLWDALTRTAPEFVQQGVRALVTRGTKSPVSAADVKKAFGGK